MERRLAVFFIGIIFLFHPAFVWAEPNNFFLSTTGQETSDADVSSADFSKVFQTQYTSIYYSLDEHVDDFIWRLGGQRLEFVNDPKLASYRIDRLVSRVETILDMWPKGFQIDIYLHGEPFQENPTAHYEHASGAIHVYIDHASDGVVAHEIAHAVIVGYFGTPPPSKMQEILAQYVDKYLWSDY